jgi:MFS family permease
MTSTTSIKQTAGSIGVRSAFIGSLLFAVVEGISIGMNETDTTTQIISAKLLWIMTVFGVGSLLSVAPGYAGGKLLERLRRKSNWNRRSLMILGATLGVLAVVFISLPNLFLVLAAHNYWSIKNNPAFTVYLTRLVEAMIIAGFMGIWSGSLIAKS